MLWYADGNRIVDYWFMGSTGWSSYSNMEQIINDWQHDGGSKPISLGDLNKHSWPNDRIGFSLWDGAVKRRINRWCRGVKTCSTLTVTTKSSLSQAERARVVAGVSEAVP